MRDLGQLPSMVAAVGDNAPLVLVVYGDYECPSCRVVHRTLETFRRDNHNNIAIVYQHWPLSNHRFAYTAARAVECAREQGKFEEMHNIMYDTQDSLGLVPFVELAERSGILDLTRFELCSRSRDTLTAIEQGIRNAMKLNARGTPAVIANGWYLGSLPNTARLDSLLLAARVP